MYNFYEQNGYDPERGMHLYTSGPDGTKAVHERIKKLIEMGYVQGKQHAHGLLTCHIIIIIESRLTIICGCAFGDPPGEDMYTDISKPGAKKKAVRSKRPSSALEGGHRWALSQHYNALLAPLVRVSEMTCICTSMTKIMK